MRHLIDTQILLWSLISPARLSESSRRVLANHESEGIPILSSDANFQLYRPAVQVLMNG